MAADDKDDGSVPAIIGPWVRVIRDLGFPILVAGLLLYYVLFRFADQTSLISIRMEESAKASDRITSITQQWQQEQLKYQQEWSTLQTKMQQEQMAELKKQTADFDEILRILKASRPPARGVQLQPQESKQ